MTWTERARVYLSYLPTLFLFLAVPRLWQGAYAPMLQQLSGFVLPFALWSGYVLVLISITDLLIARLSQTPTEKTIMRTIAASFLSVGALIVCVHAVRLFAGTTLELYLNSLANLSSLLPSLLLVYYIYRYHYLEMAIKESLVIAAFAAVVLVIYLYGIRTIGVWATGYWSLRPGSIEALLILLLALVAAPLRRWLDVHIHRLFARETALYRDIVTSINTRAGEYKNKAEMIAYIEQHTAAALNLRRVRIILRDDENAHASDKAGEGRGDIYDDTSLINAVIYAGCRSHVSDEMVRDSAYEAAYPLCRQDRVIGVMLIAGETEALTFEARAVLEILAGQVAIAVEEKRLIEENVMLERKLAQGERLAALGQMAATIAHEVKNPLSAIKSIAQVMGEDARLKTEYKRDIDLIVGETDRLNRSVTQLLSFAKSAPDGAGESLDHLINRAADLFRAEAARMNIVLEVRRTARLHMNEETTAALRDGLSNLLLNAIQATPCGGRVMIDTEVGAERLTLAVMDGGPGVAPALRERIWEPFFTTKQRGTGLGLAIVRKRMEEIGGVARLVADNDAAGSRFELIVPLKTKSVAHIN